MGRAIAGSRGRDFRSHRVADRAISTINANLMLGPRILFAMGRDGLMSRCITSINSGGTPSATLFLSSAVTIGLVLSARFEALVAITAILFVAVYLSGFASLFVLRARERSFCGGSRCGVIRGPTWRSALPQPYSLSHPL